jgi:hypothetical protein
MIEIYRNLGVFIYVLIKLRHPFYVYTRFRLGIENAEENGKLGGFNGLCQFQFCTPLLIRLRLVGE